MEQQSRGRGEGGETPRFRRRPGETPVRTRRVTAFVSLDEASSRPAEQALYEATTGSVVTAMTGEPVKYDPTFKGPLNKRSCTDVICLGLFLVFVGAWIFVGCYVGDCQCSVLGFTRGDPSRLLLPTDSQGRKCGLDTDVIDKPYLFFFDLTRCIRSNVVLNGCPTPQVCVKSCPEQNFFYSNSSSLEDIRRDIICKTSIDVSSISTVDEFTGHVDREDCARYYLSSKAGARNLFGALIDLDMYQRSRDHPSVSA
uniref:Uncharacterized protein n=1 Tax=Timema douglasi TaxID=61478 RepID=A0A7R8VFC2_TIMDO|nr:unnamed protein product [Timema douglasi]